MGRLRFIDGLRGVAAVMVMLRHLLIRTSAGPLADRGYLGVAIFFVLSGFVITMVAGTHRITPGFLGRFALRRAIRLDIPYWVSIALALVLTAAAARMGVPKQGVTVAQILAHMVYLQEILRFDEISAVYWTLCLEVQFYLTLIVALWISQALRAKWENFLKVFVGSMAVSVLIHLEWLPNVHGLMFPYWWAFGLGSLCYWTLVGRAPAGYLALSCAALFVSSAGFQGDWRLTSAAAACLLYIASQAKAMERWLADRVSQFFGRISYSLYLFHPLAGWSAQSLALRHLNQWAAFAVGLVSSVACAWLAYLFIERSSIRLSHSVGLVPRAAGRESREASVRS
jgi:peptidoglycan/LPS O-acetylase OafA/YrhL